MSTTAKKGHAYFAGLHSYSEDFGEAFVVRWLGKPDGARPGWYWADAAGGLWNGPATSSRAAFRAAKKSRERGDGEC